jgi:hypothetical protein
MIVVGKNFLCNSGFRKVEFNSGDTEGDFRPVFTDTVVAFHEDRLVTERHENIAIGLMLFRLTPYHFFCHHKNSLPRLSSTALEGHMRLAAQQMLFMINRPGAANANGM